MDKSMVVYVLSDSIGETAEEVAKAAISQFDTGQFEIRRVPYITDKEQILEILEEAKKVKSIILFTIVLEEIRDFLIEKSEEYDIRSIDVMEPIINVVEDLANEKAKREPGLIRKLDESYFQKVAAVEFAVKYDDGKDTRGIKRADIVLIGVSRTSKTPLSMYLAHKNIKVANIPLLPEVKAPKELYEINSKKIIGLTASPEKLNEIRQERLKALGLSNNANYASMDRINKEIKYAEDLMNDLGCRIIDVSNKAVEETAGVIMELFRQDN